MEQTPNPPNEPNQPNEPNEPNEPNPASGSPDPNLAADGDEVKDGIEEDEEK